MNRSRVRQSQQCLQLLHPQFLKKLLLQPPPPPPLKKRGRIYGIPESLGEELLLLAHKFDFLEMLTAMKRLLHYFGIDRQSQ